MEMENYSTHDVRVDICFTENGVLTYIDENGDDYHFRIIQNCKLLNLPRGPGDMIGVMMPNGNEALINPYSGVFAGLVLRKDKNNAVSPDNLPF